MKGVRNTMDATERTALATLYGQEYMGKIFYYCLRKTGDSHEAEDLASDITLQVLTTLHNGACPVHFPAWVWQIARNRYALWAQTRRHRTENESFVDPDEPETESILTAGGYNQAPSVSEEYVRDEEMAILRRELAFLGRDYREIVVAYYLEDRSVSNIAASLGLPEGTVKSRLFRSRNLLKEGIQMAREFGPKSYKPEEVRFEGSGSQASGLPWSAVQRALPKNILLEASNNPSTAEELAVAVGVAMPYMEEEIALLTDAQLLKQVGNRYVTNFFIMSHDLQAAIQNEMVSMTADLAERYDALMEKAIPVYRAGCYIPASMTDGELKWFLSLHLLDRHIDQCNGHTWSYPIPHKHPQDTWGFIGFEGDRLPDTWFVGYSGSVSPAGPEIWSFQIGKWNMYERGMTWTTPAIQLISEMILQDRRVDSLTPTEKEIFDRRGPHTFSIDEEGRVIPNLITFRKYEQAAIYEKIATLPEYVTLQEDTQAIFDRVVEMLRREGHEVLSDQLHYCASMVMCNLRPILLDALVDKGILTVPADPDKSTVAMALYVK